MEFNSEHLASTRSENELIDRVQNRQKYLPETIEASIAELQNRGHQFSEDELETISNDITARQQNALTIGGGLFNSNRKAAIVEDPDAPMLYSKVALYAFTVFCGALFGSIMLAINCNKLKNTAGIIWALLFGVIFTVIQIIGAGYVNAGSSYNWLCGLIAGQCVDYFLWNKLIGNAAFYRAKPIWKPLIIAVVLLGLVILVLIYGSEHA